MSAEYNRLYHLGRFVVQITMPQFTGLVVQLTPSVAFTAAGQYLLIGFGFEWLFSSINIGIMNKAFQLSEKKRLEVCK